MSVSLRSFTTIQRGKGERGRKSIELASSANVRTNTMLAFSPTKKEMEKKRKQMVDVVYLACPRHAMRFKVFKREGTFERRPSLCGWNHPISGGREGTKGAKLSVVCRRAKWMNAHALSD